MHWIVYFDSRRSSKWLYTAGVPVAVSAADSLHWMEQANPRCRNRRHWSPAPVVRWQSGRRRQHNCWNSRRCRSRRRRTSRQTSVPIHQPSRNGLRHRGGGRHVATRHSKGSITWPSAGRHRSASDRSSTDRGNDDTVQRNLRHTTVEGSRRSTQAKGRLCILSI